MADSFHSRINSNFNSCPTKIYIVKQINIRFIDITVFKYFYNSYKIYIYMYIKYLAISKYIFIFVISNLNIMKVAGFHFTALMKFQVTFCIYIMFLGVWILLQITVPWFIERSAMFLGAALITLYRVVNIYTVYAPAKCRVG